MLLQALHCVNQAFTLSCATELHSPAVCSWFITALSCGRCHATGDNQEERQRAVPNHKQCLSLLLLLLLLSCTHFYPLIQNSIGGSTVLSVSASSECWHNHWPQMGNTTECLHSAYPIPQGVIHLSMQPGCPWSPPVSVGRLVFAHPEGCGHLSDDLRAAPGTPLLWPLWIGQHNNLTFCP